MDIERRRLLVARIEGSAQANDLTAPTNCGGYGRVRHFSKRAADGWPDNFLPIRPASLWLGLPEPQSMNAQVFQLAACAWRCWYCYVPYPLLSGDSRLASWRSAEDLVRMYLKLPERSPVLDLSGGSPDLAPEWIVWTLDAIEACRASKSTFVWSDDNLSSDALLRPENAALLRATAEYPGYGRACCLKGYSPASFAFNTGANPAGFEEQIRILTAYASSGLNIYVYLPLVEPDEADAAEHLRHLLDRLGDIRSDLLSRTVPLHIAAYSTVTPRLDDRRAAALKRQWDLLEVWLAAAGPPE